MDVTSHVCVERVAPAALTCHLCSWPSQQGLLPRASWEIQAGVGVMRWWRTPVGCLAQQHPAVQAGLGSWDMHGAVVQVQLVLQGSGMSTYVCCTAVYGYRTLQPLIPHCRHQRQVLGWTCTIRTHCSRTGVGGGSRQMLWGTRVGLEACSCWHARQYTWLAVNLVCGARMLCDGPRE